MEVTQSDKAITLDCGCNVNLTLAFRHGAFTAAQGSLHHCKLHASAPALLEALLFERQLQLTDDAEAYPQFMELRDAAIEAAKGDA